MPDGLFDGLHHNLAATLDLRQRQHELTASNIANADTPGYHARVMEFDGLLERMFSTSPELQRTDERHLTSVGDIGEPTVTELDPAPWAADGNSVVAEREAGRLAENAVLYRSVSTGLSRRLALLRYAASDGRG
jgi:flagellar basal-body rod protein FlgB